MSCNRFTVDEYAFFAIGTLEGPERDLLRSHVVGQCETCLSELREAFKFWYFFATITEDTQGMSFPEPSPMLRDRVIGLTRRRQFRRTFANALSPSRIQTWMRIAAAVIIAVGTSTASWRVAQVRSQKAISAIQARVDQQAAAARKLESENNSLRNLVIAARNAPAVFPGRESIVSVQDPYLLRDLQQARQTQVASAQALAEERAKAADLDKRLAQTTGLLAAATRDREDADRQYRKAFDAAILEKDRGVNQLSTEIGSYKAKVQDLESQISRYRTVIDSQTKGMEQHSQVVSLLQSSNLSLVQLHSTEAGKTAHGVAFIADNGRLAFFPSNLPAAPAGRTYQLWLIRDNGIVSAGTFHDAARDTPTVQLGNKQLLKGIRGIAVTEEPAGGSPQPTGRKLMTGSPKS